MRIAVCHDLPSGGAKRALRDVLKRLSIVHAIDVYTLSTADQDFCDLRPLARNCYVFPFQSRRLFRSPLGRLNQFQRWRELCELDAVGRRLASSIDSKGYDVVFVQPCMFTQAPLALLHLTTPAVYFCQEPPRVLYEPPLSRGENVSRAQSALDRFDPLLALYRRTARRLDWKATRCARVVLVNSRFACEAVARVYGVAAEVAYLGVDTELFCPEPGTKRQGFVLSVGAIAPQKGFAFLIECLGSLPAERRPPLRLVGNTGVDGYAQFLDNLARTRGVKLQIEVAVDNETLVRRYREATLVAYAPHNEPFGLVPLEAMACGTPVVGVAEGGVLETVVDGVTGLLVRRHPAEFGSAIADLFGSRAQRERLGDLGVRYVRDHWSWDTAVERIRRHLVAVARQSSVGGDPR